MLLRNMLDPVVLSRFVDYFEIISVSAFSYVVGYTELIISVTTLYFYVSLLFINSLFITSKILTKRVVTAGVIRPFVLCLGRRSFVMFASVRYVLVSRIF